MSANLCDVRVGQYFCSSVCLALIFFLSLWLDVHKGWCVVERRSKARAQIEPFMFSLCLEAKLKELQNAPTYCYSVTSSAYTVTSSALNVKSSETPWCWLAVGSCGTLWLLWSSMWCLRDSVILHRLPMWIQSWALYFGKQTETTRRQFMAHFGANFRQWACTLDYSCYTGDSTI